MSSTGMANNPNLSQAFILLTRRNGLPNSAPTRTQELPPEHRMRLPPYCEILFLTDPFTTRMRKQFAISTFNQQVRLRIRYNQPARRTVLSRLVVHTAVFTQVRIAAPIQLVLANFIEETTLSLGLAT